MQERSQLNSGLRAKAHVLRKHSDQLVCRVDAWMTVIRDKV